MRVVVVSSMTRQSQAIATTGHRAYRALLASTTDAATRRMFGTILLSIAEWASAAGLSVTVRRDVALDLIFENRIPQDERCGAAQSLGTNLQPGPRGSCVRIGHVALRQPSFRSGISLLLVSNNWRSTASSLHPRHATSSITPVHSRIAERAEPTLESHTYFGSVPGRRTGSRAGGDSGQAARPGG
jgi:hypothetical protein